MTVRDAIRRLLRARMLADDELHMNLHQMKTMIPSTMIFLFEMKFSHEYLHDECERTVKLSYIHVLAW